MIWLESANQAVTKGVWVMMESKAGARPDGAMKAGLGVDWYDLVCRRLGFAVSRRMMFETLEDVKE